MTVMPPPGTETRQTAPPPRVRRYRPAQSVQPGPRSRVNTAVIYIVVAMLITAVGLLYLIQTNHVAGLGYEMSQLQRERETLSTRNEQLNYSIARYESLTQVESVAVDQLGMSQSDTFEFITVPRPARDQLVLPEPASQGNPSLIERIWHGLTGSSTAVSSNVEAGE